MSRLRLVASAFLHHAHQNVGCGRQMQWQPPGIRRPPATLRGHPGNPAGLAALLQLSVPVHDPDVEEVKMKPSVNAVLRTNIINMLETHLPDERRAIAGAW
jgi:hypothetical protein